MKVYFYGSISGGPEDIIGWYRPMILHIENRGVEVTSRHIFFNDEVLTGTEEGLSKLDIHDRDISFIDNSECLVGDITKPSHGVGYEIRHAMEDAKRILSLHRTVPGRDWTAMFAGRPRAHHSQPQIVMYSDLPEAYRHIDEFFERIGSGK